MNTRSQNGLIVALTVLNFNLLFAMVSNAQAPASILGSTFGMEITNGTYPFASSGDFLFLPASSGNSYQIIDIVNVAGSTGTYSFSSSGASGILNLSDSVGGSVSGNFDFNTSISGSYSLSDLTYGGNQSGDFVMFTNPAPNSITGQNFYINVQAGSGGLFASSGDFIFTTTNSGKTYTITAISAGGTNSYGTYSYSKPSASCGGIQLTDSVAGISTAYVVFTNSVSGGYYLSQPSSASYQVGYLTMLNADAPPSIAGDTFIAAVTSGAPPFASYGYCLFVPTNSTRYEIVGIEGVTNSSGTYTYSTNGAAGTVNLNDSIGGAVKGGFFYFTPASGSYALASGASGQNIETGNFALLTNAVPNSIAGQGFYMTVTNGGYPYASSGGFTFSTAASGNTYKITAISGGGISSSGTYSYTKLNASCGGIQLTDSVAGISTAYMALSNSILGGYVLTQPSSGGFQIGFVTFLDTAVSIASPTSASSYTNNSNSINLSGTANDNLGITQITWSDNLGGGGTASGTTAWTANGITLQSGTNIITVTAYDTVSNTAQAVLMVIYDPPPMISITSPTSASTYFTNVSSINLGGTASDTIGVTQVTWSNSRGGSGTASGTTAWSVNGVALTSGTNLITVVAHNVVGNTNNAAFTVTYDTTLPAVAITSPTSASSYITNVSSINLDGTASDTIGVTQVTWSNSRGGSGTASGTTAWSITGIALQSGTNLIKVVVFDAAGNTNHASLTVTNDTTPPTVEITSPTSGSTYSTNIGSINLGGTASDTVGVTRVTWSNNRGGNGTASGTTAWSVTGIALQGGTNLVAVTAYDTAGNTAEAALAVAYNLPVIAIVNQNSRIVLTWPTNAIGFTLEYTTNLLSTNWTTNSSPLFIVNKQYTITNTVSNTAEFYRLSNP